MYKSPEQDSVMSINATQHYFGADESQPSTRRCGRRGITGRNMLEVYMLVLVH